MKCKKCEAELPAGSSYCCFCGVRQFAKKATRTRGNGTGSVYKRGKTWTAAISVGHYANGSCCRKTKGGFKTKNEAVLYLDKLRADPFATKQEIRICQLYDAIQPHLDKLSDNKRSHYRTAYARLESIWNVSISALSIQDLQRAMDAVVSTYYPAKDIRDLLSLIYQQGIKEEYISVNKARYLVLPDLEEKDTVPFTAAEISSLWEDYHEGNKNTGFFLLMIYTGMMPGEALKTTVDMVQLSEKRIVGAGLKTSKRKETPIILPDIIVPVVQDLIAGKSGRLWETDNNNFYDYFCEMKKRTGCRMIKELRPYSCRHTTATTLADQNVSAAIIKEVMRHAKLASTQRYMHVNQDRQEDAMNTAFGA